MNINQTENEAPSLWSQFEKLIDLHKFYFENLIKAGGFSFGIVGAILTYVINASLEHKGLIRFSLGLPLLMSIGTLLLFCLGFWKTWDLNNRVKQLQNKLDIDWRPHSDILIWMCGIFAFLFFILSSVLLWLFINPELLPETIKGK